MKTLKNQVTKPMQENKKMKEETKITLQTETGEPVDFFVLEETRINGKNYLLVTDEEDEKADGECYILEDTSKAEEAEAVYRFVEDDQELDDLFQIFARLLDDADKLLGEYKASNEGWL